MGVTIKGKGMKTPLYVVWHPDSGENGPEHGSHYRAMNAEQAAEAWAKDYNEGDYPLSSNECHGELVKVAMVGNEAAVHTFKVRAEMSIDYYADTVHPEPDWAHHLEQEVDRG